jgi:hypothetical protein
MLHVGPIPYYFVYSKNILWRLQIMNIFILYCHHLDIASSVLRPNVILNILFLNTVASVHFLQLWWEAKFMTHEKKRNNIAVVW